MSNNAEIWRPEKLPIDFFRANGFEHSYDRHTHDEFAIGVMEFGVQKFYCMHNQNFAVERGIITINPDELHDGHEANGGRLTYRMMYIDPSFFRQLSAEISKLAKGLPFFGSPFVADSALSNEFLSVHRLFEAHEKNKHCTLERDSRLIELLAEMIRRHVKYKLPEDSISPDKKRVALARDFIHDSFAEKISLDTLSKQVGLSRYHFLRMFRAVTGISPHAYLSQVRLNRAKRILREGCINLSEVAQDTGFYDQAHFSKKFKSAFGITPAKYAAFCATS